MKKWLFLAVLAAIPAGPQESPIKSAGAQEAKEIRLACTYYGATSGTENVLILDDGTSVVVGVGIFTYAGKSDPYEIRAEVRPNAAIPKKVDGFIEINRTTGDLEVILFIDGNSEPLVKQAHCEAAKPKF